MTSLPGQTLRVMIVDSRDPSVLGTVVTGRSFTRSSANLLDDYPVLLLVFLPRNPLLHSHVILGTMHCATHHRHSHDGRACLAHFFDKYLCACLPTSSFLCTVSLLFPPESGSPVQARP